MRTSLYVIVVCITCCITYCAENEKLSIASIIDQTSWQKSLVKLHSIIESTNYLSRLKFKFLLFNINISAWESKLTSCFGKNLNFESKMWTSSLFLQNTLLNDHKFSSQVVFARFYLPQIFVDTDTRRMLYLDNDIIVTTDVIDFLSTKMILAGGNDKQIEVDIQYKNASNDDQAAPVSLVFEKAIFYRFYIQKHFNISHSYVQRAISLHGGDKCFCNSGVVLYDTHLWREQNQTGRVEELLLTNRNQILLGNRPIFDSTSGDQGVYYLLQNISYLEPRFNMRRHPVKSVSQASQTTGIIHFAGTLGGIQNICKYPLLYPQLLHAALPLYLSVYASVERKCYSVLHDSRAQGSHHIETTRLYSNLHDDSVAESCGSTAVQKLLLELERVSSTVVSFQSGLGNFTWPPIPHSARS